MCDWRGFDGRVVGTKGIARARFVYHETGRKKRHEREQTLHLFAGRNGVIKGVNVQQTQENTSPEGQIMVLIKSQGSTTCET